jgi:hypothetical protein
MYSILQSVNKGVAKPVRFSLNFFIGTVFYVILHWLLFSSFMDKYPMFKKFKYAIYVLFAVDFYVFLNIRNKQRNIIQNNKNGEKLFGVNNSQCVTVPVVAKEPKILNNKLHTENNENNAVKDVKQEHNEVEQINYNELKINNEIREKEQIMDDDENDTDTSDEDEEIKENGNCKINKLADVDTEISIPVYNQEQQDTSNIDLPVYNSNKKHNENKEKHVKEMKEKIISETESQNTSERNNDIEEKNDEESNKDEKNE